MKQKIFAILIAASFLLNGWLVYQKVRVEVYRTAVDRTQNVLMKNMWNNVQRSGFFTFTYNNTAVKMIPEYRIPALLAQAEKEKVDPNTTRQD